MDLTPWWVVSEPRSAHDLERVLDKLLNYFFAVAMRGLENQLTAAFPDTDPKVRLIAVVLDIAVNDLADVGRMERPTKWVAPAQLSDLMALTDVLIVISVAVVSVSDSVVVAAVAIAAKGKLLLQMDVVVVIVPRDEICVVVAVSAAGQDVVSAVVDVAFAGEASVDFHVSVLK